jgi:hypothetical protein
LQADADKSANAMDRAGGPDRFRWREAKGFRRSEHVMTSVLFPDPREAVPLGGYLDLALWLLGRNPIVAELAHRIPGVVETGPAGTTYRPTRLALTIRARDRLAIAWDEWADANRVPASDTDLREEWEAVNGAPYVGTYAEAIAAWDSLGAGNQTVLRLLSAFGLWRTPVCLDDLLKLEPSGWQAAFLADYRRAAQAVR